MPSFEFYRYRFQFEALDPVHFPPGQSANVVRGAWGTLLRRLAPPETFQRLFKPRAGTNAVSSNGSKPRPSGLADWPRPFVFRAVHLDGASLAPGDHFFFDAHVFDVQQPVLPYLQAAFAELAAGGIGPTRGRAQLQSVEALDLEDHHIPPESAPCSLPLDPFLSPTDAVTVAFVTPTELKAGGYLADRPEFGPLFTRLRDRISTLRALYGPGALDLDFRGLGDRSAQIVLTRCDLVWERAFRKSTRTGQTHPLGGFTGEADYQGALAEFLPWLRAARWVGVGRQTVWGKGDIRVLQARGHEPC